MCGGVYAYEKVLAHLARKLKASSTNWLISIISPTPWLANIISRKINSSDEYPLKHIRTHFEFRNSLFQIVNDSIRHSHFIPFFNVDNESSVIRLMSNVWSCVTRWYYGSRNTLKFWELTAVLPELKNDENCRSVTCNWDCLFSFFSDTESHNFYFTYLCTLNLRG